MDQHSTTTKLTPQQVPIHDQTIQHHVRFAEMAELYVFDDYGPDCRPNTWYTEREYANFQRSRIHDLIVYKKSQKSKGRHDMNDHDASVRGLEPLLSRYAHRLQKHRQEQVVDAVLETQNKFWDTSIDPSQAIAFAASKCTYSSKNDARERAYEDHIDVLNMIREEEAEKKKEQRQKSDGARESKYNEEDCENDVDNTNVVHKKTIDTSMYDSSIMSPNGPATTTKPCFNPLSGLSSVLLLNSLPPFSDQWRKTMALQTTTNIIGTGSSERTACPAQ